MAPKCSEPVPANPQEKTALSTSGPGEERRSQDPYSATGRRRPYSKLGMEALTDVQNQ